ncbi:MAG: type IV toxin-antitoxin system AbiEi family antitoxin [Chitinophagaceae bacterium]
MKHKTISTQSGSLLHYFNEKGKPAFGIQEATSALPSAAESTVRELLRDMVRRGLLMRLKEGVYHIIPYEQDATTYMPDWHLAAEHLVGDVPYYIGYYSALQLFGLITQPSLKEQVVVARQVRPSTLQVKNVSFQFIYHNETHFFGAKKKWIDSFHKVQCSDLEKTFVDCLFKPEYAGGIVEIAKAIYAAKGDIKFENLLAHVKRFNAQSVIKRLGFLLQILDIPNPILAELRQLRTASYTVLDTELPKEGKFISEWSIQQNIGTETLKSAIST